MNFPSPNQADHRNPLHDLLRTEITLFGYIQEITTVYLLGGKSQEGTGATGKRNERERKAQREENHTVSDAVGRSGGA